MDRMSCRGEEQTRLRDPCRLATNMPGKTPVRGRWRGGKFMGEYSDPPDHQLAKEVRLRLHKALLRPTTPRARSHAPDSPIPQNASTYRAAFACKV